MNTIAITVEPRSEVGSKSARVARNEGLIPCVMYGGGEVIHFTSNKKDLKDVIYTPDFQVVEITINGKTHRCILKNTQFHPVSEAIEHVDFLELIDGKSVKVELPVRFEGSSPGVKNGGKLQQSLRRIKVKTTPENLIDQLVLNISKLKLGQAIRVRDIQIAEGIEVMSPPGTPVATVEIPRALRSATGGVEEEEEEEGTASSEEASAEA